MTKTYSIYGLWIGWATGLSVSTFCLLLKLALVDWYKAAKNIIVVANPKRVKEEAKELELQVIKE